MFTSSFFVMSHSEVVDNGSCKKKGIQDFVVSEVKLFLPFLLGAIYL